MFWSIVNPRILFLIHLVLMFPYKKNSELICREN